MPFPRFRRLVCDRRPPLLCRTDFGPGLLRASPRNSDRGRASSFPHGFPAPSTTRRVITRQLGQPGTQPSKNRPALRPSGRDVRGLTVVLALQLGACVGAGLRLAKPDVRWQHRSKDQQPEFPHTLLCRPLELSALVGTDRGFDPKRLLESMTQQDYCERHQQEHQPGYRRKAYVAAASDQPIWNEINEMCLDQDNLETDQAAMDADRTGQRTCRHIGRSQQ